MYTKWLLLTVALLAGIGAACTEHRVEVAPVEVKPIHITIDVNVKIDREIDDYFGDLFEQEEALRQKQENATQE
ncbi:MAG: hypothetical protein QNI89_01700 [Desulfobacterales bacterium]|nr:hypothetical protein [Desulfobacterales bacterium]MDJ0855681.1 hypothetical protein [Desulfobacterales bacterium]MDJ0885978.1 hypothetical protein [Desulfobacterales bacterium]MDJ0988907.1 hypothetical protein [Desulfobacterales bacterium]